MTASPLPSITTRPQTVQSASLQHVHAYNYTSVGPDNKEYTITIKAATKARADEIFQKQADRAVALSAVAGQAVKLSGKAFDAMQEGTVDRGTFTATAKSESLVGFKIQGYFDVKFEKRKGKADDLLLLQKIYPKLPELQKLFETNIQSTTTEPSRTTVARVLPAATRVRPTPPPKPLAFRNKTPSSATTTPKVIAVAKPPSLNVAALKHTVIQPTPLTIESPAVRPRPKRKPPTMPEQRPPVTKPQQPPEPELEEIVVQPKAFSATTLNSVDWSQIGLFRPGGCG